MAKMKGERRKEKNHDSVLASDGAISLHVISKFRRNERKERKKRRRSTSVYKHNANFDITTFLH